MLNCHNQFKLNGSTTEEKIIDSGRKTPEFFFYLLYLINQYEKQYSTTHKLEITLDSTPMESHKLLIEI